MFMGIKNQNHFFTTNDKLDINSSIIEIIFFIRFANPNTGFQFIRQQLGCADFVFAEKPATRVQVITQCIDELIH